MKILLSLLAVAALALAQEKTVNIVTHSAPASGEVRRDLIEECIHSLPSPKSLQPVTEAKELYLKHQKGVTDSNGHVKVWTARVNLGYLVRQKYLYVVGSGGIQPQPAQFREVVSTFQAQESIESHPGDSDFMAGANPRTYYFVEAPKAAASAQQRAQQRLSELKPRLCPDNPPSSP